MIETKELVLIEAAEADDATAFATARARAVALGVPLVVRPPAAKANASSAPIEIPPAVRTVDIVLSRADASDHRKYQEAARKAAERGGVVVVA
jgi:hypothetical protein